MQALVNLMILIVCFRYYDQISLLHSKLPQADIPFKWRDAFEKGGLFSSGSLTVS